MEDETTDAPITRLLQRAEDGDASALDAVVEALYDDLRQLAHRRLEAEQVGHTLNTTAVVHEAYLRISASQSGFVDRGHFFAVTSRVMRHVLVDYARARSAGKRGGELQQVTLSGSESSRDPDVLEVLELEDALTRLEAYDERLVRLVECRFFGGLSMDETAAALGISSRTATRDWRRAQAYLYDLLRS